MQTGATLSRAILQNPGNGVYGCFFRSSTRHGSNPLTWTVFHAIGVHSPLYGMSSDDPAQADALLAKISVDDNSSQQLEARQTYSHDQIRWQQPLCRYFV
jgi:hypothetical protein